MSRAKVFISILTVLILIALSGASVWAAPNRQGVSGDVQNIQIDPWVDPDTGETITTVLVTLEDVLGGIQTVRVSLETAIRLELLTENGEMITQTVEIPDPDDPSNTISGEVTGIVIGEDDTTVLVTLLVDGTEQQFTLSLDVAGRLGLLTENGEKINQTVDIPDLDVIEYVEDDGEQVEHPVASALANYFADALGLDYDMIMGYHEDGMGFGVIANACWIAYALEGDATLLGDILEAKKSGDFSSIELPDGTTAKNWGQFRKAALGSDKAKKNLGAIMSGRAKGEQEQEQEQEMTATQAQGKDKGGPGTPPGKDKNKDKNGGKPDTPPGQDKDKGGSKDKGGGKGKNK